MCLHHLLSRLTSHAACLRRPPRCPARAGLYNTSSSTRLRTGVRGSSMLRCPCPPHLWSTQRPAPMRSCADVRRASQPISISTQRLALWPTPSPYSAHRSAPSHSRCMLPVVLQILSLPACPYSWTVRGWKQIGAIASLHLKYILILFLLQFAIINPFYLFQIFPPILHLVVNGLLTQWL